MPVIDYDALPEVDLSEAALLDAARHKTGLADFGDEADWKEGFTRLLHDLHEESRLNKAGRVIAFGELLRHLENRLRVTEDIKRNPVDPRGRDPQAGVRGGTAAHGLHHTARPAGAGP